MPSLSRDDFRFVLQPWEHRGAQFDSRPDCVTTIELAGARKTVLLKARAERLFFQFADWLLDEWRQPVFAVTQPFTRHVKDAETFFHHAMQQKQIARYVICEYNHNIKGHTLLIWLINETGTRQTGWAREWCGGEWVAWTDEPPSSFHLYSVWKENWHPLFPTAMYDPIWPTIARRRFEEKDRQNLPARWVCGSSKELSNVLRAYFCIFPEAASEVNEELEEWGEYGTIGSMKTKVWAWSAGSSGTSFSSGIQSPPKLWKSARVSERFHNDILDEVEPRWAELMVSHNHAVGLTWHYNGKDDLYLRENWWYEVPIFDLNVPLPFPLPPTQHEQMEARLFLRDWLRDKIPEADIEEWLVPCLNT